MTGTLCQSAALTRVIAPWLAMIAAFFAIMIKTVLAMVEKVGNSLHEPDFRCRKAGRPELRRLIWPCSSSLDNAPCRFRGNAGAHHPRAQGMTRFSCPRLDYRRKVMGF